MIGVLGNEDLRQQVRRGDTLVDHVGCHRGLNHGLAVLACPLAADMALYRELSRFIVELLADVFANACQGTATRALC